MSEVTKIQHNGKEILLIDYTGCKTDEEMVVVLYEAIEIIKKDYSDQEYLQLTNLKGSQAGRLYMTELKKSAKIAPQTARKKAVLGVDSASRRILLHAYNLVLGKKTVKPFDDIETAKDWLASD